MKTRLLLFASLILGFTSQGQPLPTTAANVTNLSLVTPSLTDWLLISAYGSDMRTRNVTVQELLQVYTNSATFSNGTFAAGSSGLMPRTNGAGYGTTILQAVVATNFVGNAAGLTNLYLTNLVWVVRQSGQISNFLASADTAGAYGQTLTQAMNTASAGELIMVGTANFLTTTPLGKNGVDWWFAPGSTVSNHTSEVWYDGNTQMRFSVGGNGTFVATANFKPTIYDLHYGSVFDISAKMIVATGESAPAVKTVGATFIHVTEGIYSEQYDGVWALGGFSGLFGHTNLVYVDTPILRGATNVTIGNAYEGSSGQPVIIRAGQMSSYGTVINFGAGPTTIDCDRIFPLGPNPAADISDLQPYPTDLSIRANLIIGVIRSFADGVHGTTNRWRIIDATIDSSTNALPTIGDIDGLADSLVENLTLQNVKLISKSTETYSLSASNGTTSVEIRGGLIHNKGIHSNVTLTGTNRFAAIAGDGGNLTNMYPLLQRTRHTDTTLTLYDTLTYAIGNTAITLPTAIENTNREFTIVCKTSGTNAILTTGGQTISGYSKWTNTAVYTFVTVASDGTNWFVVNATDPPP